GHAFVRDALERGASATFVETPAHHEPDGRTVWVDSTRLALGQAASWFFGNPSRRFRIIAATGTNGKTSTAYLIRAMLRAAGKKVGYLGTVGYEIGDESRPAPLTTPDPLMLQSMLAEMVACGTDACV